MVALRLNAECCLPPGYWSRVAPLAHDDRPFSDEFQDGVYRLARDLYRTHRLSGVLDLGCGSGFKLMKYFARARTIGVEIEPTLSWLRARYAARCWCSPEDVRRWAGRAQLVICADVLEHLDDPREMLEFLAASGAERVVVSTPDRIAVARLHGAHWLGPPPNPAHAREWSRVELVRFLSRRLEILDSRRAEGSGQIVIARPLR